MMHRAWSSIVEVPYCFSRPHIKFQGHTALKIVEFDPNWAFPDSNSSLNSQMAMKCCTKLETAKERCPIVFQGHPSNFKVTRYKTSPILTQIGRFQTIGRLQLSNPSDLPFFKVIRQISRSHILYTHMYTHTHTYILFVLQIDPHHTYIYRHIYSASPHRVKYLFYRTDSPLSYIYILSVSPHRVNICFTTQMAQFYHIGETDNLDGDLSITISYTHLYTPTHKYTVCFTDSLPSYISIYILIYSVSPHRVKYLFYRTDRLPSCIYIHIYSVSPHIVNICFTTQMAQFYHTGETNNLDGDLSITILYTHMYRRTHIYCLFYR